MIAWPTKQIGQGKLYTKSDINDKKVGVKLLLVLTLLTYFNIRSMFWKKTIKNNYE